MRPSADRRRSTARLVGLNFLVATLAAGAVLFFGRQVEASRREGIAVARLDGRAKYLMGGVQSLLLGRSIGLDVRGMRTAMDTVAKTADPEEIALLRAAHDRFAAAVEREADAMDHGHNAEALGIDIRQTDPAFERLNEEIDRLGRRCDARASAQTMGTGVATALSMLLAAALLSQALVRYRRRADALIDLEVRERAADEGERRFRALFQNVHDVIAVVSPEGEVAMVSGACESAWGRAAGDLVGTSILALVDPQGSPRERNDLAAAIVSPKSGAKVDLGMRGATGDRREFEAQIVDLTDDPDVGGVLVTFHDLTERKRIEAELEHRAFHDRLTGLPNRALFMNRLAHRLAAREADGTTFAVLFVDLDNFKVVNDSLGHEAGDALLVEVARRIVESVRATDTVARLGGDEFTLILNDSPAPHEALGIAERILERLGEPILVADRELFVACSVGVVMADAEGIDAASLLRDADTAMYRAKGTGKARAALFEPNMSLLARERLEMEADLRAAIRDGSLSLAYQPVVDIATGRLREVEALVRWDHPTRGSVPPAAFIPLAEETGLIVPLGRWVLQEACAHLAAWNDGQPRAERLALSVNVSGRQLAEADFVADVRMVVGSLGLDPALLELEVGETAMLRDLDRMRESFARLRAIGVRVAVDDFGTGTSSMACLSGLAVDTLKIDRSFVGPLGQDERVDGVVRAMISTARTLGLETVGEGVETDAQWRVLQAMGCGFGQGFLFDHPLAPEAITELLATEPGAVLRLAA